MTNSRPASLTLHESLGLITHELRQPMHVARFALDLARRADSRTTLMSALNLLARQIDGMRRLLDDLACLQRDGQFTWLMHPEVVDLRLVARALADAAGLTLTRRGQQLVLSLPVHPACVRADIARLNQVVLNLIRNASSACATGSRILLTIDRDEEEVRLRVADSGRGMTPRELADVTALLEGETAEPSGEHGLGLAIVGQLVRLHGGRIDVASDGPGKGSAFVVAFPAETVVATEAVPV